MRRKVYFCNKFNIFGHTVINCDKDSVLSSSVLDKILRIREMFEITKNEIVNLICFYDDSSRACYYLTIDEKGNGKFIERETEV